MLTEHIARWRTSSSIFWPMAWQQDSERQQYSRANFRSILAHQTGNLFRPLRSESFCQVWTSLMYIQIPLMRVTHMSHILRWEYVFSLQICFPVSKLGHVEGRETQVQYMPVVAQMIGDRGALVKSTVHTEWTYASINLLMQWNSKSKIDLLCILQYALHGFSISQCSKRTQQAGIWQVTRSRVWRGRLSTYGKWEP
jgi:hypothetical protein